MRLTSATARPAITDGLVSRKSLAPVPQATLYKTLRIRLYPGDFDSNGKTYRGVHVSIVTKDLWDRVQAILDQRFEKRHRKYRHQFAFSGLISCGHCGRVVAPRVGLEPTTLRLTAGCSTIELSGSDRRRFEPGPLIYHMLALRPSRARWRVRLE